MRYLVLIVAFGIRYLIEKPFIKCVMVPVWWFEGLLLTSSWRAARRYRLNEEIRYWTRRS